MSTQKEFIERCRRTISKRYDRPSSEGLHPLTFTDTLEKFMSQAELAGCKVVEIADRSMADDVISTVYPDAKVIASNLPEVKSATLNPDTVEDAAALNHTDVGVVEARFGVAENGSVWIPQAVKERDVCFISENLVAVLPKKEIVNNMHEAYKRITLPEYGAEEFRSYGYGVFIAGPSKTADIAQVLVNGAQAARSMTLLLVG